jgi:hypothetical protein
MNLNRRTFLQAVTVPLFYKKPMQSLQQITITLTPTKELSEHSDVEEILDAAKQIVSHAIGDISNYIPSIQIREPPEYISESTVHTTWDDWDSYVSENDLSDNDSNILLTSTPPDEHWGYANYSDSGVIANASKLVDVPIGSYLTDTSGYIGLMLLHEIGHNLGLRHSHEDTSTVNWFNFKDLEIEKQSHISIMKNGYTDDAELADTKRYRLTYSYREKRAIDRNL